MPDKEQVTKLVKRWIEGEAHIRDVLTAERDAVSNDQAKENVTKELARRAARVARVTDQLPTLEN